MRLRAHVLASLIAIWYSGSVLDTGSNPITDETCVVEESAHPQSNTTNLVKVTCDRDGRDAVDHSTKRKIRI